MDRPSLDLMKEVYPQGLHELAGVLGLGLPVHDLPKPLQLLVLSVGPLASAPLVLVHPVRRDAVLSGLVHVVRADLDLERLALRPDDRRVERLVHVGLRHGDVVLEAAR